MPKSAQFSFTVPGTPEQVSKRIRGQTQYRILPAQGTLLTFSDRPLAGRVNEARFTLALNHRDWLTLLQAVAKGTLVEVPEGTRIEGSAGLPGWLTWQLRLSTLLAVGLGLFSAYAIATGVAGTMGPAMAAMSLSAVLLITVLAIGLNVRNADEQLPELVARLTAAAHGAPQPEPEPLELPLDVDEAAASEEARRRRAQQASRQKQG